MLFFLVGSEESYTQNVTNQVSFQVPVIFVIKSTTVSTISHLYHQLLCNILCPSNVFFQALLPTFYLTNLWTKFFQGSRTNMNVQGITGCLATQFRGEGCFFYIKLRKSSFTGNSTNRYSHHSLK